MLLLRRQPRLSSEEEEEVEEEEVRIKGHSSANESVIADRLASLGIRGGAIPKLKES